MFAVSLILPIVALCLVVYFFWYPLPLLLGAVEYSQELDADTVRVKELAYAREQDDEYETLLALGFRPLGTQNELYGFLSTKSPTLVFAHDQLPIFAYLIVNLDQQLFLKMITSGTGDCILTTCSCANGAVVNEPTYRSNIHAVSKTEELFALHVKAIEEWELEGFEPLSAVALNDAEQQSRAILRKEATKKLIRDTCLGMSFGSLVLTVFLPAIFGGFSAWFSCTQWQFGVMSPILVLNFVAGWSIFYSAVWYKNVFLIEKNPELNSLKNRSANLSAKRVDIQRVVSGNETTLRLPCRDTSDQLSSVLIFALATLFGAFFFCFVIGNMGVGCVQLGGFLSLIPLALFSLCFLRAIMRIGGPAWRILLGRSRHELSIANGRLATREIGLLVNNTRYCRVDEITGLRIESVSAIPGASLFASYAGEEVSSDCGVLVIELTPGKGPGPTLTSPERRQRLVEILFGREISDEFKPIHAASCYRLDLVASLGHELAKEIGLSPDKVTVSETILNHNAIFTVAANPDRPSTELVATST